MPYIDVMPVGGRGKQLLTYRSDRKLATGTVVKIPYGKRGILFGLVAKAAAKPEFTTKTAAAVEELPPLPKNLLLLAEWCRQYYGAELGEVLRLFLTDRPDLATGQAASTPVPKEKTTPIKLNRWQQEAVDSITGSKKSNWLLHGVTGSGKTAVYIELCRRTIAENRSAIVLVPEITLTTQVVAEFKHHLSVPILVNHSGLTAKERREVWSQALHAKQPVVIIGPRSSLFLPVDKLGLIAVDECHDGAYKQEQTPSYHARDVAARLSRLAGAKLVLGSATPSTQDMFLHRSGLLELLELPEPIHEHSKQIDIVDMRQHKDILSQPLRLALKTNLDAGRQSLLFLNRRGSASQVLCSDCGHHADCPLCHLPQTWHGDIGKLQCHVCGRKDRLPGSCPECGSLNWKFIGLGTKRIETEVGKLFPAARLLRLDRDSFSAKTIDRVLESLQNGDIDILIGTQMIAKGLDLPNISLVGVVLADTLLHIPDIYSNERTYQLLHQVAGRAGRAHNQSSRVIIQSYSPDHPAIKLAVEQDFHRFIDQELEERKVLGYPPYRYSLKLTCRRRTQAGARKAAQKLSDTITQGNSSLEVRGPAPAWRETLGQHWYWQLIIFGKTRSHLTQVVENLPSGWSADIDPVDFL